MVHSGDQRYKTNTFQDRIIPETSDTKQILFKIESDTKVTDDTTWRNIVSVMDTRDLRQNETKTFSKTIGGLKHNWKYN